MRLAWHRLASRATSGLIISQDASELAAPMAIQNATQHTVHVKQVGVPIVSTLRPGEVLPYAWDKPARRLQLLLSVPALAVRFRSDGTPCRLRRPWVGALLGRSCVELHVATEGATTRIVLRDIRAAPPMASLAQPLRPLSPGAAPATPRSVTAVAAARSAVARGPTFVSEQTAWHVNLQLPNVGVTLLDGEMLELLYLSLRGLRVELHRWMVGHVPTDTLSLALASVQLDCQLPRTAAREEVLLQIGVAARGDAVNAQLAVTRDECDSALTVVQRALISLQEITLRLDEEAIETVAAALQGVLDTPGAPAPAAAAAAAAAAATAPQLAQPSSRDSPPWSSSSARGMQHELAQLRDRQLLEASQRVFVQQLRLSAIPLKLSLQRASRPDAGVPEGSEAERASQLRWLRWLGIILIGLDDVPLRMPEVAMQRALLPAGSLAQEVQQQYARALMQQAYKLLPSAALLGDPYGVLRTLRERWGKIRLAMRHTPWPYVPAVAVHGAADLLRAGAASSLRATGKSARALSSGLEALLSEQYLLSTELSLPEAAVRGVGGLARETARAIELALVRINEVHPVPPPLDSVLAACLLPFGVGRGVQRLVLLVTLASLSLMRSTAEACRGILLGPAKPETGRSRTPRVVGTLPLYPMCAATVLSSTASQHHHLADDDNDSSGIEAGGLLCAVLASPPAVLVLTATTLRCTRQAKGEPPLWELPLAHMLLVQQRAAVLHILMLASTYDGPSAVEARSLTLQGEDDAARLHEILRLAGMNARKAALPPTSPRPQVRATIFELLA